MQLVHRSLSYEDLKPIAFVVFGFKLTEIEGAKVGVIDYAISVLMYVHHGSGYVQPTNKK